MNVVSSKEPNRRNSDASNGEHSTSSGRGLQTLVDAASSISKEKTTAVTVKQETGVKNSPQSLNVIQGRKEDLVGPSDRRTFGAHLMEVLDDSEHDDVLQWCEDGLTFEVVDHKKFLLDKMPKLFNIRNMSSFVRKLNRWGFTRAAPRKGNNDVFQHPHFQKGKPDMCRKLVKCIGNPNKPTKPEVTPESKRKMSAASMMGDPMLRLDRPGFGQSFYANPLHRNVAPLVNVSSASSASAQMLYRHEQERRNFLNNWPMTRGGLDSSIRSIGLGDSFRGGLDSSIRGLDTSMRSLGDSLGPLDRSLGGSMRSIGGLDRSLGGSMRSIDVFAEHQYLLEQQAMQRKMEFEMLQRRQLQQQRVQHVPSSSSRIQSSLTVAQQREMELREEIARRRRAAIRALLEQEKALEQQKLINQQQLKQLEKQQASTTVGQVNNA